MNVIFHTKTTSGRRLFKEVLCILFFTCICSYASASLYSSPAPVIEITGKVVDTKGAPVIGASIQEKGTMNGTITDLDGNFNIEVESTESILIISFIGYATQELTVGAQTRFEIVLQESVSKLDELVVIGYGSQKKADVTSAVVSVKSDEFNKGAIQDAGRLIQGKVAGLQIALTSGDPQASSAMLLRGYSSLLGTTDPLVLIDGIPGSLSSVAPEDIETINVLKDGSSTAIYGTRGTNGVIIITTKGVMRETEPTIEYSGYVSASQWLKTPDFLNAQQLRDKFDEGWTFSGGNNEDLGYSTNWLEEISQTAITHVSNLSLKGGNSRTGYLANITYDDNQGTMKTSGATNMRARLQVQHSMFDDKLKAGLTFNASETNTDMPNNWNYIYRMACIQNPTQAVYDEDGAYVERDIYNYNNPVSYLYERVGMSRAKNIRSTGSLEYKPVESVTLKAAYTRKDNSYISGSYYTKQDVSSTEGGNNGYAYRYARDYVYNMTELSASWVESFGGKHYFTAIAGYNYEDNTSENFSVSNKDFPSDNFTYHSMELGQGIKDGTASVNSYKYITKLIGLFARATYNYDNRYLAMVSFRHEGSTKFGSDYQWGNFPGISLGWRMNNESFMKDLTWIDNLKLRAGFGITGTDAGQPYHSLASLDYMEYFLYNGKYIHSLESVRNSNPRLRWEKKLEYNVGFDFDLYGGRVGGAIDVYQRDTKDGLYNYKVPSPPYQDDRMDANVCEIRNRGFEILINAVPVRTADFNWNTSLTYSCNKNKLLSLQNEEFQLSTDYQDAGHTGEPIQTTTHRIKEGWAIGNFYGLRSVGLNSAGKWLVERYNFDEEGNPVSKYYDLAENAGPEDWQILGNGVPMYFLNWNNNVQYKNWDLSVSMRGAFGFQILNYQKMYYGNPTIQYNVLNSAFDELPVVDPKTGEETGETTTISDSQRYVSYYVEDGDYWKIDNLTLGYTFNTNSIKNIKHLRVYGSVYNLATFTRYTGLDPEVRMTYGNGFDPGTDSRDKYPTIRSFTLGINLTF